MGHGDKRWRLVCYDVRDAKRWRDVHRIVRGHGRRLQYSVYRCRLDDRETEKMRWDLSKVMEPEDDLLIVDLCPSCTGRVVSRNDVKDWTVEPAPFHIVGDQAPSGGSGPGGSDPEEGEGSR